VPPSGSGILQVMTMKKLCDLRPCAVLAALLFLPATPALAQFQLRPMDDGIPALGELYHIEASAGFWTPAADMAIASESLGIVGTVIDFKQDLGLTDKRFREVHLVLRPARKHKFRFQYIPIRFVQSTVAARDLVFNGQRFAVNLPVNSELDWKAYRFGYEFDFLVRDTWYAGFVLDFKQTDVRATLATPIIEEFRHIAAPIPALGGTGRYYILPNVSITGEVTIFRLPENVIRDTTGRYIDVDFYGTMNFNRYLGAQLGYRSFDVGYSTDDELGDFRLKGFYFGAVARY
jgi:hypothetical protein